MPNPIEKVKLKDAEGAEVYPEIDPADKGTPVVANPTLAGTEADLTGIQVGETKYKVAAGGAVSSVNEKTGAVVLDKTDIGLGNVDNTSDLNKPISTATQTALNGKQATLVSGTNIKTINNESILGSGNIDIQGGGSSNDRYFEFSHYSVRDMKTDRSISPSEFLSLIEQNIWNIARSTSYAEFATYYLYYEYTWYKLDVTNITNCANGKTTTFPHFSYTKDNVVYNFIRFYNRSSYADLPILHSLSADTYSYRSLKIFPIEHKNRVSIVLGENNEYFIYYDEDYEIDANILESLVTSTRLGNEKLYVSYSDGYQAMRFDSTSVEQEYYRYSANIVLENLDYRLTITTDYRDPVFVIKTVTLETKPKLTLNFNYGIEYSVLYRLCHPIILNGPAVFNLKNLFDTSRDYQDLITYEFLSNCKIGAIDTSLGKTIAKVDYQPLGSTSPETILSLKILPASSGSGAGEDQLYALFLYNDGAETPEPVSVSDPFELATLEDITFRELIWGSHVFETQIDDFESSYLFPANYDYYRLKFMMPNDTEYMEINFARFLNSFCNLNGEKIDHFKFGL